MKEPSADLQNRVLLLKGRRLRVMSEGDSRLIVRSAPAWLYALLMAVCVVLGVATVLLSWLMLYLALFPPRPDPVQDVIALVIAIPCAILCPILLAAPVYLLLTLALPRVTIVDLASGTIHIRQIPGLSRRLAITQVATVDLVMLTDKGTCHLGFTNSSTGALHSIHWLGGTFDAAIENRNNMLPAARLVARFLDKPLESSWGIVKWSFRKGRSEPLPPE